MTDFWNFLKVSAPATWRCSSTVAEIIHEHYLVTLKTRRITHGHPCHLRSLACRLCLGCKGVKVKQHCDTQKNCSPYVRTSSSWLSSCKASRRLSKVCFLLVLMAGLSFRAGLFIPFGKLAVKSLRRLGVAVICGA